MSKIKKDMIVLFINNLDPAWLVGLIDMIAFKLYKEQREKFIAAVVAAPIDKLNMINLKMEIQIARNQRIVEWNSKNNLPYAKACKKSIDSITKYLQAKVNTGKSVGAKTALFSVATATKHLAWGAYEKMHKKTYALATKTSRVSDSGWPYEAKSTQEININANKPTVEETVAAAVAPSLAWYYGLISSSLVAFHTEDHREWPSKAAEDAVMSCEYATQCSREAAWLIEADALIQCMNKYEGQEYIVKDKEPSLESLFFS